MSDYLEISNVDKTYEGSVHALRDVSLSVRKGRVHAIIGENGAGKSTLAKILGGLVPHDSGTLRFKGSEYRPASPRDADARGIGMVHQHFMLFPSLTVAENIILGDEPGAAARLDMRRAEAQVRELSERYGMPLDPRVCIEDLSVGEQQRVEILKALYRDVELVIFDEPTAVLTPQEVEKLFKGIRRLIEEDYTVIIIAHKLEEVLEIADDITVLRRGEVVGSRPREGTTAQDLVRMMVGSDLALEKERGFGEFKGARLEIEGLTVRDRTGRTLLSDIDLTVHAGEIVGVAGVEGNGQIELEQVLGGLLPATSGRVTLDGNEITAASPRRRRQLGLAYIPADRLAWGCAPAESLFENAISQEYRNSSPAGILKKGKLRGQVADVCRRFDVRTPGLDVPISSLSGGNIQKLILGRELTIAGNGGPKVLVISKPTRGIDIRGVDFIHDLLCEYRDAGCAIILISTDMDEIVSLSDRIAVLYGGRLATVLPGQRRTGREELGRYMLEGSNGQQHAEVRPLDMSWPLLKGGEGERQDAR